MAASLSHSLVVMRNFLATGGIKTTSASCYPCLNILDKYHNEQTPRVGAVRWAYQPKSKAKRKSLKVPGYRIGVTKAWDSWHTGNLSGSYQASEILMDDIMIRKLIEGMFYELLLSDIIIKRRDNQIIIAFYAAGSQATLTEQRVEFGEYPLICPTASPNMSIIGEYRQKKEN